jgi:hypothetical protein
LGGSLEQASRDTYRTGPDNSPVNQTPAVTRKSSPRFSLIRSAPAVVLFAIVIADSMRSADTDLWGHIFFGNIVLRQHHLFFHAPFSYACPAGPRDWIMVDWLGEALMALVINIAGVIGIKIAKFGCVAGLMVLLSLGLSETGAVLAVQAMILLAAACAFVLHMQLRTFLADDLGLAAIVLILAQESYGRTKAPLWLAIPVLAIWANLHGGFFVGLVAMGVYTCVRAIQDLAAGRGAANTTRLAALTSAVAIATLVNPYGLKDWIVVAGVLRNSFTLIHISEFRPLPVVVAEFYHSGRPLFTFAAFIAIVVTLIGSFLLTPRSDDLPLFAIAIVMSAGALYAVRNTALAVIACSIPLCRHADLLLYGRARAAQDASSAPSAPTWQIAQLGIAAAAITVAIRTGLLSNILPAVETKPVGAVAFIREHSLEGNVLAEFGWADYVLFHDSARLKIFIESIFEAYYPPRLQNDFANFYYGAPGAEHVLDEYPNDFVLMPTGSPASALTAKQPGWRLIYRDPVASLFARSDSTAARLPGVPFLASSAPPSTFP